jgi:hypothetical protein
MIAGMELAGGRVMPLNEMRTVLSNIPPGDIRAVVPNITPDPETGIGRWTDAQIATAIREGRRPDGSIIGPPMPIALYRGLSDRDLMAIVTYLRTVPPKRNAVTQRSTYPFALEHTDRRSPTWRTRLTILWHGAHTLQGHWHTAWNATHLR